MPDDEFQIVPASSLPRARTKKTRRVRARLLELAENPYAKDGSRLVLRMPSRLRHCVKTCAKDLKIRIQTATIDDDWIMVYYLQDGEKSGLPGQPVKPEHMPHDQRARGA